jgi:hypothetical protein
LNLGVHLSAIIEPQTLPMENVTPLEDEDIGVHLVVFPQPSRPYISIKIPKESEWYCEN